MFRISDYNKNTNLFELKGPQTDILDEKASFSKEAYESSFLKLLDEPPCKNIRGIVYLFKSKTPISRLKGESNIAYIGKTVQTFRQRYRPIISNEGRDYFVRYRHIIQSHGGMYIEIIQTDDPDVLESLFLKHYHDSHLELPPLNLGSFKQKKIEGIYKGAA